DRIDPERVRVILALETSCDDTCAAVVTPAGTIRSNVISSQGVHDRYGGVVPEIASRHHLELIGAVLDDALARAEIALPSVDLVAVTCGPGLVAALLVGVATAKGLAAAHELPLAPVDHLHGHVAAAFLGSEAFDKGARLLGLGYPGGPALERLASGGDPHAFRFPVGERLRGLDFSFAGLKTSLLYRVRDLGPAEAERRRADLAASYQRAIVESLAIRVQRALRETGLERLSIGGGVAANGAVRERMRGLGVELHVPARELCTDNAAMIASAARFVEERPYPEYLDLDVYATGERLLMVR